MARFRCGGTSPDAHKAVEVAVLTAVNVAIHSSSEPLSTKTAEKTVAEKRVERTAEKTVAEKRAEGTAEKTVE